MAALPIWEKNMEISRKSELREYMKSQRSKLSPEREEQMNFDIFKKLVMSEEFLKAESVYCYADCRHEAGTGIILDYLWSHGIKTALPRVAEKQIEFYYVKSYDELCRGCMGIMEPKTGLLKAEDKNAFVIVPGLAFDRAGGRLGYGGGYYDRFFELETEHYKVGIGFDFQLVQEVPREHFDALLNEVLIADT